jgi:hypothetical protein
MFPIPDREQRMEVHTVGRKRSPGAAPPRVFISYARADSHIASRLATELRESKMTVFLDQETIAVGSRSDLVGAPHARALGKRQGYHPSHHLATG